MIDEEDSTTNWLMFNCESNKNIINYDVEGIQQLTD